MSPPLYYLYSDIIDKEKMEENMANKKASQITVPAKLADNEPMIPKELADKYRKHVEEQKMKEANLIGSATRESSGSTKGSLESKDGTEVIGTSSKDIKPSVKAGHKKPTVAIYSDRNVSWIGVGKISKGYNIVTKEQASRWLTRNHVREATPEEVASQFGV
jgi:hypothetical protein